MTRMGLVTTLVLLATAVAAGQHQHAPAPPTAGDAQGCAQAQMVVDGLIEQLTSRVESARLTNSPADMRAAIEGLQGTVRDLRTQLAPCAGLTPADPHAGHVIAAPSAAPGAAVDAHAGHDMPQPAAATATQEILGWIDGYDAAFLAKDLDRLATFYHPDVTVFEGAGLDDGWADYRDTHLGPELKAFEDLSFGHTNYTVHMLGDRAAYVTSEFFIKARLKTRMLDLIGRETLIVEKDAAGAWKIRHSHTGTRARPAA